MAFTLITLKRGANSFDCRNIHYGHNNYQTNYLCLLMCYNEHNNYAIVSSRIENYCHADL